MNGIKKAAVVILWMAIGIDVAVAAASLTKDTDILANARNLIAHKRSGGWTTGGRQNDELAREILGEVYAPVAAQVAQRLENLDPSRIRRVFTAGVLAEGDSAARRQLLDEQLHLLAEDGALDLPIQNQQVRTWVIDYLITIANTMLLGFKLPQVVNDLICLRGDETKCVPITAKARVPGWFPHLRELANAAMALDAVENCGIQAYTNTGGDMVMCGVRGKDSPIVHRPGGKVYPQENPDNTDWYDLITCKAFVGSRTAEEVITCSPSTETVELLEWLKKLRRGIIGKMACTTLGLGERLPNLCMCVVKSYKLIISDAESGELYLGDWQSDDSVGYKLVFLQQVVKPAEQGIVNPQNACYFNASMQLLYNIPNIRYELQQYSGSNEVMLRLRELFIGLEGGSSVVATNFWSAMEKCVELPFSYRTQADAQELISHLINYCQEKWTKDMTYLYNGGQFSSIVPKDRAKHLDWMVFQPLGFYALPLSTRGPNTLQKAIEKFGESEQMIGDNKMSMPWRSNTSYETSSIVTKTARIVDPPPFLMIHLKRFKQDGWGRTVKNDTQCEIPEFLDIGRKDAPLDPAKYRLISAICHYGALSGGHYKNYSWNPVESKDSKDPRKKGWIQFNDNARTWMGNYERVKDDIKDRGYMLLFMRTQ